MKSSKSNIRQYKLSGDTKAGIVIHPLNPSNNNLGTLGEPHRDDHYKFLFATRGMIRLKIDFKEVIVETPGILCVHPGQVHHLVEREAAQGWVMGVDVPFLEKEFQSFIESQWEVPIPLLGQDSLIQNIEAIFSTAHAIQCAKPDVYRAKSILYLVNALLCLVISAKKITSKEDKGSRETRGYVIEQAFKQLLKNNFKEWKRPSQYASVLSISVSHLNDTIKEITELSVSAHIQERLILEAKRLLYFTDMEVREIAFNLGYGDPVHFGKLFKRAVGSSPLDFRKQFRD